ncbi:MAG: hypothetical protein CBB97_07965 [Candidatus Endolissoclinum sp. TMED37]|nr:MAG: hypothetical protein CBB97_07965 [Candidatus Endolissoclinum sp. TMED37]|tara:strand:+ start:1803 stop:2816 length:1014 start_codon:yes stop_codon:yes gene_type:complete
MDKKYFIDPSYEVFYKNRLFESFDETLNRDDQLYPFRRMKDYLSKKNDFIYTADLLMDADKDIKGQYVSLGILSNLKRFSKFKGLKRNSFVIMEPPVVANYLYKKLPYITKYFDKVYLHNTVGDGYDLTNIDKKKLKKFYWPIPYNKVIDQVWNNKDRSDNIVMINGNHKPSFFIKELYSKRINVLIELSNNANIDLYGKGWDQWWSRKSWWFPYIKNYFSLRSIYKGSCHSKFEVLKNYKFCICFENMEMKGYISEKIFDCFYSGAIPIYLGATDVKEYIPEDTFIDYRNFENSSDLLSYLKNMKQSKVLEIKNNAKAFLSSSKINKFYDSLINLL